MIKLNTIPKISKARKQVIRQAIKKDGVQGGRPLVDGNLFDAAIAFNAGLATKNLVTGDYKLAGIEIGTTLAALAFKTYSNIVGIRVRNKAFSSWIVKQGFNNAEKFYATKQHLNRAYGHIHSQLIQIFRPKKVVKLGGLEV